MTRQTIAYCTLFGKWDKHIIYHSLSAFLKQCRKIYNSIWIIWSRVNVTHILRKFATILGSFHRENLRKWTIIHACSGLSCNMKFTLKSQFILTTAAKSALTCMNGAISTLYEFWLILHVWAVTLKIVPTFSLHRKVSTNKWSKIRNFYITFTAFSVNISNFVI